MTTHIIFGNIPVNHIYDVDTMRRILTEAKERAGEKPVLIFAGKWFVKQHGVGVAVSVGGDFISIITAVIARFAEKFDASKIVVLVDYAELVKAGEYAVDFDEIAERIRDQLSRDIDVVVDTAYYFESGGKGFLVVKGASLGSKGSYTGQITYYILDSLVNQYISEFRKHKIDTIVIGGLGVNGTITNIPGFEFYIIPALDIAAARAKEQTTGLLVVKDGELIPITSRYPVVPYGDPIHSV